MLKQQNASPNAKLNFGERLAYGLGDYSANLIFSVKISIPLENTGVPSVFATSVWPFSLIFSLA